MHTYALVNALLDGLHRRYSSMLKLDFLLLHVKDAVIASVSHPNYKLKWVPSRQRHFITTLFKQRVSVIMADTAENFVTPRSQASAPATATSE